MAIIKTKNGTYRLRIYRSKELQEITKEPKLFEKTFKTKREAREAEKNFNIETFDILKHGHLQKSNSTDISFEEFYKSVWLSDYIDGHLSTRTTAPSRATIKGTKDIFRIHNLPMFGDYSLNELNDNKNFVLEKMKKKSIEYANFKIIRSYVNSIFDWAEELEYIERNNLTKSLSRIRSIKKETLKSAKKEEDLYLNQNQLQEWISAFEYDYKKDLLTMQDYLLFIITLILADRKSETYALKWKHINFKTSQISVNKALDRFGIEKNTKGNKNTIFVISSETLSLLEQWKHVQQIALDDLGIKQNEEQLLFTFKDYKGNVNQPLHIDYLNYRMNSVRRRHPYLEKASPHKLRHTAATLAKQSGKSLEEISEALTHSDTHVTKNYVNAPDIISSPLGESLFNERGYF
ncbi:tyrosine-type recombinase/integrase [Vagococcus carniphilus]|uniref:site-specific integrase n=1 Tax=Vagococcus carniphilus TaxID=218144 RepID=UPI00288CC49B|nr:tyrosine-type recombinase/integrase [Vagococcus carniphilus]MDT2830283.1 tyrosine-type recombinase/integrase [Vagococcus carniphilus]MDT2838715.1 tyrosine-type recombinase/integrase [Vagococcus carniphilus]MDT2853553.1 tyrosine-type recombinase/integrase [Vagococcus carniphilus]